MDQLPPDFFVKSNAYTPHVFRDEYPSINPSSTALSQSGKVIIITGASSGIGARGFAPAFAKAQPKGIVLVGRKAAKLNATKKRRREARPENQSRGHHSRSHRRRIGGEALRRDQVHLRPRRRADQQRWRLLPPRHDRLRRRQRLVEGLRHQRQRHLPRVAGLPQAPRRRATGHHRHPEHGPRLHRWAGDVGVQHQQDGEYSAVGVYLSRVSERRGYQPAAGDREDRYGHWYVLFSSASGKVC